MPVVSIDGKKKEFLGSLYREGKLWVMQGEELVRWDHDFPFLATGKVTPFGIYDLNLNTGFMVIGNSSETSEFAVNSIGMWWNWRGRYDYPGATQLLVLSDCGGGCSYRTHLFKQELQKLADRTGLTIRIAHYPPGCSKWNRIEHRLFPHITRSLQGTVFETHEQVAALMERAKTETGLEVKAYLNIGEYATGKKAGEEYLAKMPAIYDAELPDLNYSFVPEVHWNNWSDHLSLN